MQTAANPKRFPSHLADNSVVVFVVIVVIVVVVVVIIVIVILVIVVVIIVTVIVIVVVVVGVVEPSGYAVTFATCSSQMRAMNVF